MRGNFILRDMASTLVQQMPTVTEVGGGARNSPYISRRSSSGPWHSPKGLELQNLAHVVGEQVTHYTTAKDIQALALHLDVNMYL